MKYITTINERQFIVEIVDEKHVILDGQPVEIDFQTVHGQPVYSLLIEGRSYEAYVNESDDLWQVLLLGDLYSAHVEDEREKRLKAAAGVQIEGAGEFHLKAPMPGLIVSIPVKDGQQVAKGDVLLILESMKMQNELRSPKDGTVVRIKVKPGDSVEGKATLLSVE